MGQLGELLREINEKGFSVQEEFLMLNSAFTTGNRLEGMKDWARKEGLTIGEEWYQDAKGKSRRRFIFRKCLQENDK